MLLNLRVFLSLGLLIACSACGFKPQTYQPSMVALEISGLDANSQLLQNLNHQSQIRSIKRSGSNWVTLALAPSKEETINLARASNDQVAIDELQLSVQVKLINQQGKVCSTTMLDAQHVTERVGARNMQSDFDQSRLQALINQQIAKDILDYWQDNLASCT